MLTVDIVFKTIISGMGATIFMDIYAILIKKYGIFPH